MNTKLQFFLIINIKKVILLALLCGTFAGQATSLNSNSYTSNISLNLSEVNITKVFSTIEEKTDFTFVFDEKITLNKTKYSFQAENISTNEVMNVFEKKQALIMHY